MASKDDPLLFPLMSNIFQLKGLGGALPGRSKGNYWNQPHCEEIRWGPKNNLENIVDWWLRIIDYKNNDYFFMHFHNTWHYPLKLKKIQLKWK